MNLWNTLVDGMGAVLAFLYSIIPSYGVAIIGLTVLVRLLLFPLTAKQARSMRKMQLVEPEVKKLQAKYKGDRKQLNAEVMKFYKENNVNPLGGCIPIVAQMPIFIALFRVLRQPVDHVPVNSKLFKAFCGDLTPVSCKGHTKGLEFLGLDLSQAASQVASSNIGKAAPYFVLIALVVATGYIQFKQTQSRQGASTQNAQAKMMGTVFPLMFAFISYSLPSGVVLYFLISNAWQIGQQSIIFKSLPALPQKPQGSASSDAPSPPRSPASTKSAPDNTSKPAPKPAAKPAPKPAAKPGAEKENGSGGLLKRAWSAGLDNARAPQPKSDGKGATTRRSEAKARPPAERAREAGADGQEGFGRAQPSGSRPRPKKRRR